MSLQTDKIALIVDTIVNGDGKGVPVACLFGTPTLNQATFQHDRVLSCPQHVQGTGYLFRRAKKLE